jgi:hypothetical protein
MANEKKSVEVKKETAAVEEGFEDVEEAEEAAPAKKKKEAETPQPRKIKEGEDYVRGFNPARALGHADPTDPEGKKTLPARKGGFVNRAGVLFPEGYQFRGGHVAWDGRVYLNKCPRCGHRNTSDRAAMGVCSNQKANEGNGCGFSMHEELDEIKKI